MHVATRGGRRGGPPATIVVGMTIYVHGRSEGQLRRRRRTTTVVVVLVVAGLLAGGWHLGSTARAEADDAPAVPGPAAEAVTLTSAQKAAAKRAVARDPQLAALDRTLALRFARAQVAAAADGVTLTLTSGKRSAAKQDELVADAVEKYGSTAKAHRYVLPPDKSSHVQGLAVDVGPTEGALWLGEHGLAFGLCRTYANEVWHFEKLPAGRTTCKKMHPDSSWGW